jgi:hypothetical protein
MGLYNMIFGVNQASPAILATLGLSIQDFGRFRDCFISDGQIAVYTRCGGGNRESYGEVFDRMQAHPCFAKDEDDDFDCTYCTFYFRFPDEFADELKRFDSGEKFNPSERWRKAIDALNADKSPQR